MVADKNGDVAVPAYGELDVPDPDKTGSADVFLAVPDPSSETGWTTFRVKRNGTDDRVGRRIGFWPR